MKKSDTFRFQPTIRRVIYDGETEVHNFIYDEISVIFNAGGLRGKNNVSFVIPGIMSMIHPLEISDRYVAYSSRPFEEQEFVPGRKTPVVLLGAFWYDERFGVNRFCGSDEVDAAMENELFELSPHYFVVSLRLDETGSEITDYNRKE
ncbi:MAG: DUF5041 domain-containing protein [Alistipes sp.]|nr:DUF5041 domain-containing protein [Alistipes sp.]